MIRPVPNVRNGFSWFWWIWAVICLAFSLGLGIAVIHFIAKYW